jgi:hypothetical protein
MSAEKDVPTLEAEQTTDPRNVSVKPRETNLILAPNNLAKRESLSAWLTICAAGFGLISDGCKSQSFVSAPDSS